MNKSIPYGRQYIDDLDIKSVSKALQNDFITQGQIVEKFEKNLQSMLVLNTLSLFQVVVQDYIFHV